MIRRELLKKLEDAGSTKKIWKSCRSFSVIGRINMPLSHDNWLFRAAIIQKRTYYSENF
tara:strand:+ start:100 stop:276 length:177 start_codon:yes stop_codon:yes gene_type:complete